jgi:hypothetical protein
MPAATHQGLLIALLHRLPAPLLKSLDAWSYRIAQQRAERRRQAGLRLAQQRSGS